MQARAKRGHKRLARDGWKVPGGETKLSKYNKLSYHHVFLIIKSSIITIASIIQIRGLLILLPDLHDKDNRKQNAKNLQD